MTCIFVFKDRKTREWNAHWVNKNGEEFTLPIKHNSLAPPQKNEVIQKVRNFLGEAARGSFWYYVRYC